jgi:hypothetical protein
MREAILAEEQERGLHPNDRRDLSTELRKTRTHVDGINDECAIESG